MKRIVSEAEIAKAIRASDVAAYIRWAHEHFGELDDEESWQSPLWNFARLLKAHPVLSEGSAQQAVTCVDAVLREWTHDADQDVRWTSHFDVQSAEDAIVELLSIWSRIRYIPGVEPLEQALKRADEQPLDPPSRQTPGYARFVSIAGWLQVTMGDGDILLPCEKLAHYLGCEPMTVSRYRRWALEDGLLVLVKPHRFRTGGGEATAFHFDISRYPVLANTAKK